MYLLDPWIVQLIGFYLFSLIIIFRSNYNASAISNFSTRGSYNLSNSIWDWGKVKSTPLTYSSSRKINRRRTKIRGRTLLFGSSSDKRERSKAMVCLPISSNGLIYRPIKCFIESRKKRRFA